MKESQKNLYGGCLLLILGAFAVWRSADYRIGSLTDMGPGLFPAALGVVLILTGLAIGGTAFISASDKADVRLPPEWRGWFCIALGIIAFVVLGRRFGLLPATFAIVFISAMGDRRNSILGALTLTAVIMVICVIVFWWALRLNLPLLAWN